MTFLGLVALAIAGGWIRHAAQTVLPTWFGTLLVNVAGSTLAGLAVSWDGSRRAVFVIGGLGALTSVSAALADHQRLADAKGRAAASVYGIGTIVSCCLAAWLGIELAS